MPDSSLMNESGCPFCCKSKESHHSGLPAILYPSCNISNLLAYYAFRKPYKKCHKLLPLLLQPGLVMQLSQLTKSCNMVTVNSKSSCFSLPSSLMQLICMFFLFLLKWRQLLQQQSKLIQNTVRKSKCNQSQC